MRPFLLNSKRALLHGKSSLPVHVHTSAAFSSLAPSASPSRKIQIFESSSHDPFLNLAAEDWLFSHQGEADARTLFWWRNGPSVIVGRFQNPWKECHVQRMEEEKVVRTHTYTHRTHEQITQLKSALNSSTLFCNPLVSAGEFSASPQWGRRRISRSGKLHLFLHWSQR